MHTHSVLFSSSRQPVPTEAVFAGAVALVLFVLFVLFRLLLLLLTRLLLLATSVAFARTDAVLLFVVFVALTSRLLFVLLVPLTLPPASVLFEMSSGFDMSQIVTPGI